MTLLDPVSQRSRYGPRPAPVVVSGVVHAVLLIMVMATPEVRIPKPQTAYDQVIKGHEDKLIWYHFKNRLPDVKPLVRTKDSRRPRAEVKIAKQSIVSSPKNAPKADQMIWQPAPDLKVEHTVESPNILALALPEIAPPDPVKPKEFVPPEPVQRAATIAPPAELPAAPELPARANENRALKQLAELKPALKPFTPPPPLPRNVPRRTPLVPEAPALSASAGAANRPTELSRMVEQNLSGRPGITPKRFVAPTLTARTGGSGMAPALPTAPELGDRAGSRAAANTPLDSAVSSINAAIVGLKPSEKLEALPKGSRPAQFSAGPELNPNGGAGGANDGARMAVPDLMIRGGGIDARPTLVAKAMAPHTPTSLDTLRAASKYITVKDIGRPTGIRTASAPDPRFNGRQVYTMAIQMPNITSYIGSWLMWYADRAEGPASASPISPPIPHHKVDPKYIVSAVEDRVEGTIRLACIVDKAGKVDGVELVRGLDDRLNLSAAEALSKWEFSPAMRAGVPVDVEVLVEIPFRLAPRASR